MVVVVTVVFFPIVLPTLRPDHNIFSRHTHPQYLARPEFGHNNMHHQGYSVRTVHELTTDLKGFIFAPF